MGRADGRYQIKVPNHGTKQRYQITVAKQALIILTDGKADPVPSLNTQASPAWYAHLAERGPEELCQAIGR